MSADESIGSARADPRGGEILVYGSPGTAAGYEIRDFLGRSVVEYTWVDVADDAAARTLAGVDSCTDPRLPMVVLPDGTRLEAATPRSIADRLGWLNAPQAIQYDVSIYGAGPAGLSAAVYAASEGLRCVLIERHAVGGQAGTSSLIENYLGFPGGISGARLAEQARQQAVSFGAEILLLQEGVKAVFRDNRIVVDLGLGGTMTARANICATGVEWRRLDLPGEEHLIGAGVFYGASVSEAPLCTGEDVYIIGGGNSAGQAAMYMAGYARSVVLVIRGDKPANSMSAYLLDRLVAQPNVHIRTGTTVTALAGTDHLEGITLQGPKGRSEIAASRLFVLIGGQPNTDWAENTDIARDRGGYLITGPDLLINGEAPASWPLQRQPYYLETSVPGSFAAGDVRHGSTKRIASGVGEGAMAVQFVHRYLEDTA